MNRLPGREAYLRRLVPKAAGRIVVSYLGSSARIWSRLRPEGPNFINRDFMGLNLSVALGMAMAQPGQSVIVMEGDGGLLMKLESLVTVGAKAPPNLLVLTFFNNWYVTGGGQPLPSGALNLEDFAKAARFPQTATVDSPEAFDAALDRMLDSGSLGYINVRVAHDTESDVHGSVEHENQVPPTFKMRTAFTRWMQEQCS